MSDEQRPLPAVNTCRYVELSSLLDGLPDEDAVRAQICDLPFSWGNNNRTLITPAAMLIGIDELDAEDCENGMNELRSMLERLEEEHADDCYIDLEH
jgi:hypothetical protein